MEFINDEVKVLRAADEWYRESVLGQESPWREPPITAFTQPYADSKRAALAQLLASVHKDNEHYGVMRVRAVDPTITAADGQRRLTVMTGSGHGQGLSLWVWQPDGAIVRGHRFLFERGAARSDFPEDCDGIRYGTVSLDADTYLNLIAGLQTILQAELIPWWSGPEHWRRSSCANFVVSIGGLRQPEQPPLQYCGYDTSSAWRNFAPLLAAAAWHHGFVSDPDAIAMQPAAAASRPVFCDAFLQTQPSWSNDSSWWWVRERMLLMARDCGDSTLLVPLAAFLAPRFSNGGSSEGRTAAIAVSAIAAITGNDLRFADDGKPRPIADVAADYLERLRR